VREHKQINIIFDYKLRLTIEVQAKNPYSQPISQFTVECKKSYLTKREGTILANKIEDIPRKIRL